MINRMAITLSEIFQFYLFFSLNLEVQGNSTLGWYYLERKKFIKIELVKERKKDASKIR